MSGRKKIGRPSLYSHELAGVVLRRLSEGEFLTAICAEEGMPHRVTLGRWRAVNEGFRIAYARARVWQAQAVAERAVRAAVEATDPVRGRLAYEADRWMAGKLDSARYGDKTQIAGADGASPVVLAVDCPPSETRAEWIERRWAELLAASGTP